MFEYEDAVEQRNPAEAKKQDQEFFYEFFDCF